MVLNGKNAEFFIINKDGEKEKLGMMEDFSFTPEVENEASKEFKTEAIGSVSGTMTLTNDSVKVFNKFVRKIYFDGWIDTFKVVKLIKKLINNFN